MDMYVCMYVCPKIYIRRALSKKSHSRVAVSNKQKRLQCPFEPFSRQVGWAQRGRETVPDPGSSDSETPITEYAVGASNNEHRSIRRSKRAPTGVRDVGIYHFQTKKTQLFSKEELFKPIPRSQPLICEIATYGTTPINAPLPRKSWLRLWERVRVKASEKSFFLSR